MNNVLRYRIWLIALFTLSALLSTSCTQEAKTRQVISEQSDSIRQVLVDRIRAFDRFSDTTRHKLVRFDQQTEYMYIGTTNFLKEKIDSQDSSLQTLLATYALTDPDLSYETVRHTLDSLERERKELLAETARFFETMEHEWWWE